MSWSGFHEAGFVADDRHLIAAGAALDALLAAARRVEASASKDTRQELAKREGAAPKAALEASIFLFKGFLHEEARATALSRLEGELRDEDRIGSSDLRKRWKYPTVEELRRRGADMGRPTPWEVPQVEPLLDLLWLPTRYTLALVRSMGYSRPLRRRLAEDLGFVDDLALCCASNEPTVVWQGNPWPLQDPTMHRQFALDATAFMFSVLVQLLAERPDPARELMKLVTWAKPLRVRIAEDVETVENLALCTVSNVSLVRLRAIPDWSRTASKEDLDDALYYIKDCIGDLAMLALERPKLWQRRCAERAGCPVLSTAAAA
ncbi:hypothetical protein DFJ74DRAFT_773391 [Hyaloraphidium curvatum]|nr:hypothetical protein DFJ74DRAFT_773391 [Hyaloraphidium curvatum]